MSRAIAPRAGVLNGNAVHDLVPVDDGLRGHHIAAARRQVLVLRSDADGEDRVLDEFGAIQAASGHLPVEGVGRAPRHLARSRWTATPTPAGG
jgi:hypothetical protein